MSKVFLFYELLKIWFGGEFRNTRGLTWQLAWIVSSLGLKYARFNIGSFVWNSFWIKRSHVNEEYVDSLVGMNFRLTSSWIEIDGNTKCFTCKKLPRFRVAYSFPSNVASTYLVQSEYVSFEGGKRKLRLRCMRVSTPTVVEKCVSKRFSFFRFACGRAYRNLYPPLQDRRTDKCSHVLWNLKSLENS